MILIIQRWGDMYNSKDMVVKQGFIDAFKEAVKGTPYSSPKDSTSAITIKVIDRKQKKISNSGIEEKVHDILRKNDGWACISEEYRKLKDINKGNGKHSYSLYAESVNNVYNQMYLQ